MVVRAAHHRAAGQDLAEHARTAQRQAGEGQFHPGRVDHHALAGSVPLLDLVYDLLVQGEVLDLAGLDAAMSDSRATVMQHQQPVSQ